MVPVALVCRALFLLFQMSQARMRTLLSAVGARRHHPKGNDYDSASGVPCDSAAATHGSRAGDAGAPPPGDAAGAADRSRARARLRRYGSTRPLGLDPAIGHSRDPFNGRVEFEFRGRVTGDRSIAERWVEEARAAAAAPPPARPAWALVTAHVRPRGSVGGSSAMDAEDATSTAAFAASTGYMAAPTASTSRHRRASSSSSGGDLDAERVVGLRVQKRVQTGRAHDVVHDVLDRMLAANADAGADGEGATALRLSALRSSPAARRTGPPASRSVLVADVTSGATRGREDDKLAAIRAQLDDTLRLAVATLDAAAAAPGTSVVHVRGVKRPRHSDSSAAVASARDTLVVAQELLAAERRANDEAAMRAMSS
jgi:hypothetical protein